MTTVDRELLERIMIDCVGRRAAESIIAALDGSVNGEVQGSVDTAALSELPMVSRAVENLADGGVFSLDAGTTWHTCAVVGFGTVSVYIGDRRGDDAATIRIPVERNQDCLVRVGWTRLYDFDGQYYARIDCPECQGEGLVKIDPTEPNGSDTDNCRCVCEVTAVPKRLFHILVREASEQWADVWVRAVNEADIEGEGAVQVGDGYAEQFTGREVIEVRLGRDSQSVPDGHAAAQAFRANAAGNACRVDTRQEVASGLSVPHPNCMIAREQDPLLRTAVMEHVADCGNESGTCGMCNDYYFGTGGPCEIPVAETTAVLADDPPVREEDVVGEHVVDYPGRDGSDEVPIPADAAPGEDSRRSGEPTQDLRVERTATAQPDQTDGSEVGDMIRDRGSGEVSR